MSYITPQNCDACFAFSTIVVIYAWASSDSTGDLFFKDASDSLNGNGSVEWAGLLRGVESVLRHHYDWVQQGSLGALLDLSDQNATVVQTSLADVERFAALERCWHLASPTLSGDEEDVLDQSLSCLREIYDMMSSPDMRADTAAVVLSWPVRVPEAYFQMLNNGLPQALILLAHYCLLLNKIDSFWWIRGMSRYLLKTVHKTLGKEWESHIAWPLQDLVLSEFRNSTSNKECTISRSR
jgi:hypothetical protein